VLDFVGWLRAHNDSRSPPDAVGFYGLDLYGLYTSIEEVIAYLQKIDPPAADRAGERYACFEHFGGESQEAEGRSAWKQRVLPARRG
jgi:erythromycin esterase-like protein